MMSKSLNSKVFIKLLILVSLLAPAFAQAADPVVGRKAASKYFQRQPDQQAVEVRDDEAPSPRERLFRDEMMMLSLGTFVNSTAFNWKGSEKRENIGQMSYGVTYLFSNYGKLDTNLRMDFSDYRIDGERASKLSVMPLWTFPLVESNFPLYFGFGVGLGVFFQQLPDESNISLDYQLVGGARFADLFENFGFFVELALKNHLHILTNGQFNGTALTAGAVFTF